ncbi:MAG: hypothetical protein U0326_38845 [Polyangiales bacterium]
MERDWCNGFRYAGGPKGHYESYFQRANHPTRPLAFWIRYTAFSPRGRPEDAVGELWAIWFDGEAKQVSAVKQRPSRGAPAPRGLSVRVGADATLDGRRSRARRRRSVAIGWTLQYESPSPALLLLGPRGSTGPFRRPRRS